jgi:excisionase family DNA binding protein
MSDHWVSTKEAADILNTSPSWIVKLAKKKKLVARRIGKVWTIDRASLDAYAQSDRKPGPKPPYAPPTLQNSSVAEQTAAYNASQQREITIRLETRQIIHLLEAYGSVPAGIGALIDRDMGQP